MNRIFAVILLVAIIVGGFFFYKKHKKDQALTDGSYTCIGCLPPDKAAAYDRYDHGEGPDPETPQRSGTQYSPAGTQTAQATPTQGYPPASDPNQPAQQGAQYGTQSGYQGSNQVGNQSGYQGSGQSGNQIGNRYGYQVGAQNPAQPTLDTRPVLSAAPATSAYSGSDSLSPNPPNGMRFAGNGAYQWYREGNLTWRINTQTGTSCVIYATPDEWRKRIVMQHGCGNTL